MRERIGRLFSPPPPDRQEIAELANEDEDVIASRHVREEADQNRREAHNAVRMASANARARLIRTIEG